jgi:hypothetical protein
VRERQERFLRRVDVRRRHRLHDEKVVRRFLEVRDLDQAAVEVVVRDRVGDDFRGLAECVGLGVHVEVTIGAEEFSGDLVHAERDVRDLLARERAVSVPDGVILTGHDVERDARPLWRIDRRDVRCARGERGYSERSTQAQQFHIALLAIRIVRQRFGGVRRRASRENEAVESRLRSSVGSAGADGATGRHGSHGERGRSYVTAKVKPCHHQVSAISRGHERK